MGETSIGITTFDQTPDQNTVVEAASPAPTSPPMRAWVDDDGNPKRQVTMFHAIAPSTAAKTTASPAGPPGGLMMPLPPACAAPVPRRAPTMFITAAISSPARR